MRVVRFMSVLVTLIALTMTGCKKEDDNPNVVRREGNPDVRSAADSPVMKRAQQRAKDTYKTFITALETPTPRQMGFSIKKAFSTPAGDEEHIWISDLTWNGSAFIGTIGNVPIDVNDVSLGDSIEVKPAELTDWMYLDGDQLVGGYTIRAIYHDSSEEERAEMRQRVPFKIPPVDF